MRPWRQALLFIVTCLTTCSAGAMFNAAAFWDLSAGVSYAVPLMLILTCHEAGHYIAARIHKVPVTLPYFIPLPPFMGFGTMGAIIGMQKPIAERRKLFDVGLSGPLAGLLVAVPFLIWGLSLSEVGRTPMGALQEGNSLIYMFIKYIVKGRVLPDGADDVMLHPMAYAGWAGLFVTMLNLMPLGQLDGGHVAVAYFGNRYDRFAKVLYRLFPIFGLMAGAWTATVVQRLVAQGGTIGDRSLFSYALEAGLPWFFWWLMLGGMRRLAGGGNHPAVAALPLPRGRRLWFFVAVLVFVGLLMPAPMRSAVGFDNRTRNPGLGRGTQAPSVAPRR